MQPSFMHNTSDNFRAAAINLCQFPCLINVTSPEIYILHINHINASAYNKKIKILQYFYLYFFQQKNHKIILLYFKNS